MVIKIAFQRSNGSNFESCGHYRYQCLTSLLMPCSITKGQWCHMVTKILVSNHGSDNGFLSDSNKLISEPLLNQDYWHPSQYNSTENTQNAQCWPKFLCKIKIFIQLPRANKVNEIILYHHAGVSELNETAVHWCLYLSLEGEEFNSLAHGRFWWHFRWVIFMLNLVIDDWCISCEIAIRWV